MGWVTTTGRRTTAGSRGKLDVRGYVPLGSPEDFPAVARSRASSRPRRAREVRFPSTTSPGWGGESIFAATMPIAFAATTCSCSRPNCSERCTRSRPSEGSICSPLRTPARSGWMSQGVGLRNWHSGLGGGLQYRHSRHLAARVEVSRGDEGARMYLVPVARFLGWTPPPNAPKALSASSAFCGLIGRR